MLESLFNKFAGLQTCNSIKRDSNTRVFLWKLRKLSYNSAITRSAIKRPTGSTTGTTGRQTDTTSRQKSATSEQTRTTNKQTNGQRVLRVEKRVLRVDKRAVRVITRVLESDQTSFASNTSDKMGSAIITTLN